MNHSSNAFAIPSVQSGIEHSAELRDGMFTLLGVASACEGRGLHLLDLMAIGSYGLMEALESYDASLDGDFATHARPLIEQAMYGWLERDRIRRNRSAVSPSPAG